MEHQGAASSKSGENVLSSIALNDNKAGMEGLDRDKINKIILEASKGSRFYENELKKDRQVNQRIEKMMEQKAKITKEQMKQAQVEVDKLTSELERRRELGRVIVHVDMDAFYAAVEMMDCPELKDKPMAVGSMSMLSTSNYHARRFGVRAAMPGFIAKKLCPNLVIVPTNFDKYKAVSAQVREIFSDYDPHFMPASLDEAYLDMTEHLEQRKHWSESLRTHYMCDAKKESHPDVPAVQSERDGLSPLLFEDSPSSSPSLSGADGKAVVFGTSAEEAVREMRFRIEQKTSLTASAGIAPNMMLAKVCSDKKKPNGQYRIPSKRKVVIDFIKDLPVRKVSGVGKVTEKMLTALGIVSCSQLGQEMALLSLLFSETSWHHFLHISLGLGSTYIERDSERKSMSTERTFAEMSDAEEQYSLCRELCRDLAQDLQKEGLKGKTVTLKLKNVQFEVKTRASTLQYTVCTEDEIFVAAKDLLKVEIDSVSPQPLRLRLMGVRVSSFLNAEEKKPLQRSIMGFLQKGGPDPSSSVQCPGSALKAEASSDAISSESHLKTTSVPEQTLKSRGHQQQSFFQKAQSKRIQQQAQTCVNEFMSGSATTNKTAETADATKTDLAITDTQSNSTSAALSNIQTSLENTSTQCFTCPVCNREIKAANLVAFNQHIDECLEGSAIKDNKVPNMDAYPDECSQEKRKEIPLSSSESRILSSKEPFSNVEKPSISISVPAVDDDESCNFSTSFFSRRTSLSKQPFFSHKETRSCESSSEASHVTRIPEAFTVLSGDTKGPSLTCPVCSQLQSTDDLTLFNRHVDMCLNQEVLLEFRGSHSHLDHSDAPAHKSKNCF
ncbi:DNA polymerase kappa [Triplophysa tibetana]|uniref:DNA polymerase kappa n=1 Tax=Triplophysa tibetana TaxID=1572043 RepID=A0A5A9P4H7_9TELE|nr:DNA polymerase kappa [Triplophysa tibetana]